MKFILASFLMILLFVPMESNAKGKKFWAVKCDKGKLKKMRGSVSPPYYHCKQEKGEKTVWKGLSCGKFHYMDTAKKKLCQNAYGKGHKHCCVRRGKRGRAGVDSRGRCNKRWGKPNYGAKSKGKVCSRQVKTKAEETRPHIDP